MPGDDGAMIGARRARDEHPAIENGADSRGRAAPAQRGARDARSPRTRSRESSLRSGRRRAEDAAGDRRCAAPVARTRPPDRIVGERKIASRGAPRSIAELIYSLGQREAGPPPRPVSSSTLMPCPLCDDTGWKPVERDGVRRVERCDCWRDSISRQRLADANIPKRYQHCTIANFTAYNESLERAAAQARSIAERVSGGRPRPVLRRPARRRQDPPGGGRAEAGDPDDRRARAVLRHARSAARHPQHLQRRRSEHDRARHPAAGDVGRPAGPRRSRRRKDVRVGRGDDEPHRQYALQRAASDALHVQLRRHSRRHRSELAAVSHRPPHAIAAARDVRVRDAGRRRLPRDADQRRCRRSDSVVEDAQEDAARAAGSSGARAAARGTVRDGRADLKWPGGRAGSYSDRGRLELDRCGRNARSQTSAWPSNRL